MAQQDVRYYLNGMLLELEDKCVRAVATDGHRLALCEAPLASSVKTAQQVIVPRSVYDDAHEAIDRVIGAEVARQSFGVPGAQLRSVHNDAMIAQAAALLRGVTAPDALIQKAAEKH